LKSKTVSDLQSYATAVETVSSVYQHPRDPKDSIYIDLAIACGATVVTTRDYHLLSLRNAADPMGADFMSRFPSIEIITPVQLLGRVRNG